MLSLPRCELETCEIRLMRVGEALSVESRGIQGSDREQWAGKVDSVDARMKAGEDTYPEIRL